MVLALDTLLAINENTALKDENARLKKMLETLQNQRARFQPTNLVDLTPEQRLELEVQAMKAFISKHLEGE
jgi:hypothetical protein